MTRDAVKAFIEARPGGRDECIKAFFAWNVPHFRLNPLAHNFTSAARDSACRWCGRTRFDVRYDSLPGRCQRRPAISEIEDVVLAEERRAFALLERARVEVPKLLHRHGISAATFAMLHDTHGFDADICDTVLRDLHGLP